MSLVAVVAAVLAEAGLAFLAKHVDLAQSAA